MAVKIKYKTASCNFLNTRLARVLSVAIILLIALGLVRIILASYLNLNFYDEGVAVYGAKLVLAGKVPYRDFWTLYGPGQFYLQAVWFTLFGDSLSSARTLGITIFLLINLVCGLLAYKLTQRKYSALLTVFFLTVTFSGAAGYKILVTATTSSLLFFLAAIFVFIEYGLRKGEVFGTAFLLAISAWFRPDLGLAAIACLSLILLLSAFSTKKMLAPNKIATLLLTSTTLALLPYLLLLLIVPANELYQALIHFPLFGFTEARAINYPAPRFKNIIYYLPWLVFFCSPWLMNNSERKSIRSKSILLLSIFGLLMMGRMITRADYPHLASVLPFLAVIFSLLCYDLMEYPRAFILKLLQGVMLALLIIVLSQSVIQMIRQSINLLGTNISKVTIQSEIIYFNHEPRALKALINTIEKETEPGEFIYVGNYRHDNVLINEVLLYHLLNRKSATRYHELHPGITDRDDVQLRIIQDLKKHDVKWLVLAKHTSKEPNLSQHGSGSQRLDNFIKTHYQKAQRIGRYVVHTRRDNTRNL